MKRFYLAQEGHVVNALPPIDVSGGATSDAFKMTNHSHASILVATGVSAAALTSITVEACSAADGSGNEAIAFDYFAETTAAGDTLGAKTSATTSGITSPTANDNTMYVIEIDAAELPQDKPWVRVVLTNASGNSVICTVQAILSGSRYSGDQNATAIA